MYNKKNKTMNTYLLITEILAFLCCVWGARLIRVSLKKKGNSRWFCGFIVQICCICFEQFLQIDSNISIALIAFSGATAYDTVSFTVKLHNDTVGRANEIIQKLQHELEELKKLSKGNVEEKAQQDFHSHY